LTDPLGHSFEDNFLKKGLDQTYLLLLGFPLGAAVTAKAITTSKVASGTVVKPEKGAPGTTPTSPVAEVVSDDDGSADLGDYQYLLFTLLAIVYFLAQFLAHPAKGLPVMPDTLVALTGLSAAAYIAKKGVYRDPPILLNVDPPQAPPGDQVRLYGSKLAAATTPGQAADPAARPASSVLFGTTPGVVVSADPDGGRLVAEVPRRLQAGATKVSVVRPPGATSEELPFAVLDAAPVITAIHNNSIALGKDTELVVEGDGFLAGEAQASDRNAVSVDGRVLPTDPNAWTNTRVVVTLPADTPGVQRLGLKNGSAQLVVYDAKGRPSSPQPVTIEGAGA
jgi:hypothetical protein